MYTTHGGLRLTSLYSNKEGIQFVKYHRTACISYQITRAVLQKIIQKVLSKMEGVNSACQKVF